MKLFLRRAGQWLHKWLALIVGIQVFAWVLGGLVFALLPFDAWVKSGDFVRKPPKPSAETRLFPLAEIASRDASLCSIELIGQGKSFYYRLTDNAGVKSLVDANNGQPMPKPDENRVRQLAQEIYLGDSPISLVRWITQPEPRALGLVDELHGKTQLWQVNFADRFNTRLYFAPDTGEFLRARNDTWVLYDFFWRLHIMDYGNGENFNNNFLRALTPLAMLLVLSGVVLLCFSRFRKPKL
jgi:uncharacterized iron-regulated membrane protein